MNTTTRLLWCLCGVCLVVLGRPKANTAQEPPAAEVTEHAITPQPVPETIEAVDDVRTAIEAALKDTTTRPVRVGDDAPRPESLEAVHRETESLRLGLAEYLQALEAYGQTLATIRQLGEQASREQAEAQVSRLQEQAAHYRKAIEEERTSPRFHPREELDRLEVESERIRIQRDTLAAGQSKRDQERDAFEGRIRQATTALSEAEAALEAFRATPTTQPATLPADESARRELCRIRERRLAWSVALANLRLATLRQERARLEVEFDRDEPVLTALGAYVDQIEAFRAMIRQSAAELELKRIQQKAETAESETAHLYWQAREKILQTRTTLNRQTDRIRRRYPQASLDTLKTNVGRSAKSWTRFVEGLARQESHVKRLRYSELQKEVRSYHTQLQTLAKRLSEAERDATEVLVQRDSELDEIDHIVARMTTLIAELDSAALRVDARKLRDELTTEYLPPLREALGQAEMLADEPITRLAEAIEICRGHLRLLTATSEALYWSHILAPGMGWFNADFPLLREQWRTLPALWGATTREGADAARLARVPTQIAEWTDSLPPVRTAAVLAVAMTSAVLACACRRKAVRWADARVAPLTAAMKENQAAFAPLTDRLLLQSAWTGTRTAIWLAPALVLLAAIRALSAEPLGARLAATALGYVLLGGLSLALVRFAFAGERARFRVVPCSSTVAAYYRRWLRTLIGFVLLTAPFTLFLTTVDILPELRQYAVGLIRGTVVLGVALFLRNRQTVVRVVGRIQNARYRRLYSGLVGLYPLYFLFILTLFVLRVSGYGTLAEFLIAGFSQTLAALLIALLLMRVVREVTERLTRPREARSVSARAMNDGGDTSEDGPEVPDLIEWPQLARTLSVLVRGVVAMGAAAWTARAWGISLYRVQRLLEYSIPLGGDNRIALSKVCLAGVVVVLSIYVSRVVRRQMSKRVFPRYLADDRGAQAAVSSLAHYAIMLLGLYYALVIIGVTLGALVVFLGGLGLGLGLGLQPLLVNFISGLLIFFERHMRVGDLVEVGGQVGEVTRINMRSTTVRTFDNIDIVIPNGEFINSSVTNWTLGDRQIRGQIGVGVAYGTNTARVRELLVQAARANPKVLPDPPPSAWFVAFGADRLDFSLIAWFANAGDRWEGLAELRHEIDRLFRENQIEIPFPQRTLTVGGKGAIPIRLVRSQPGPPGDDVSDPGGGALPSDSP